MMGLEKRVKMKADAAYIIKDGITKPFNLTACFETQTHNLMLAQAQLACGAQKQQANAHNENLASSLNEFKPGVFVDSDDGSIVC